MGTSTAEQSSGVCGPHPTICLPTSPWEGWAEKHKDVRIKEPAIKLFWGSLSHLTLQLKNKYSKLKQPEAFVNEQLREKL